MTSAQELVERGLPETCFVVAPASGEVMAIKLGENGYHTAHGMNAKGAELMNARLGITDAQAEAMLAGSMFGWDCPAAYPETYEKHAKA